VRQAAYSLIKGRASDNLVLGFGPPEAFGIKSRRRLWRRDAGGAVHMRMRCISRFSRKRAKRCCFSFNYHVSILDNRYRATRQPESRMMNLKHGNHLTFRLQYNRMTTDHNFRRAPSGT
jgi:hypothetical protein